MNFRDPLGHPAVMVKMELRANRDVRRRLGLRGPSGAKGMKGERSITGPVGPIGPIGDRGEKVA